MSIAARVLQRMYQAGRVTIDGLADAVRDGVITEAEFAEITGTLHE